MSLLSFFGLGKQESLSPSPTDDFWYGPVGQATAAGVRVDEAVALTYSACWAATRVLCGTAGMLPFNLHKSRPGGGSDILYDHPVQRLIHDAPNADMSAMMFRTSRVNHQVNRGNCFAEIMRNRAGQVIALEPIHARRIPTHTNIKRENGRLVYLVNNDDGTKTPIRQENMFHVPSIISEDGVVGRGVVENARLTIGFGLAAEQHGAAYFGNGARPGIIIKGSKFKKPEDAEEFRRQWVETHGGPNQHGKPGILPPDSDVTVLPFNAHDSQFLESREHTVEEICRWYGIPNHFVNDLRRATFSNIEWIGIEFVKYSLMPWLKLWEQEVWRKLLTDDEKKTCYAKFNVSALERGDITSRTTASQIQLFNGLLDLDTWAEREDMNPIGGEIGKTRFMQTAMSTVENIINGPEPAPEPEQPEHPEEPEQPDVPEEDDGLSALREQFETLKAEIKPAGTGLAAQLDRLSQALDGIQAIQKKQAVADVKDRLARMLSVEIHAVKHIAEKPNKFDQRLREFYDKHQVTMTRSLSEPVSVYLAAIGDVRPADEVVSSLTAAHVEESQRRLLALCECTADQLPSLVDECVSTWHDERATVTV